MLEVSFDLRRGVIRPVIVNRYNNISILIDTGAINSVWTRGKNNFARYFPNYSINNPHSSISGFGGNADGMTCVADFRLGNEIYYPEFKVVVSLMLSMPADLILGASALSGIDYTISGCG